MLDGWLGFACNALDVGKYPAVMLPLRYFFQNLLLHGEVSICLILTSGFFSGSP